MSKTEMRFQMSKRAELASRNSSLGSGRGDIVAGLKLIDILVFFFRPQGGQFAISRPREQHRADFETRVREEWIK